MLEKDLERTVRRDVPVIASHIRTQPRLWTEVLDLYRDAEREVGSIVGRARAGAGVLGGDTHDDGEVATLTVVLTAPDHLMAAALSATEHLAEHGAPGCDFLCVPASSLVSAPADGVRGADVVLLVSLGCGEDDTLDDARAAVRRVTSQCFELSIDCGGVGDAVDVASDDVVVLSLAAPEPDDPMGSGLSSFCRLALMADLCLSADDDEAKARWVAAARSMGETVIRDETFLSTLVEEPFDRMVLLASGTRFQGLVREGVSEAAVVAAAMEGTTTLQVTSGDIMSAQGEREGLRDALVVVPVGGSDDERACQVRLLEALSDVEGCVPVALQGHEPPLFRGRALTFTDAPAIPAAYLALPYLLAVQVLILLASEERAASGC